MEKITSPGMINAAPSPRNLEGPAQLAASEAVDLQSKDEGDDRNPAAAAAAKFTEVIRKEITAHRKEVEDIQKAVSALEAEGGIGLGREEMEADSGDDDDDSIPFSVGSSCRFYCPFGCFSSDGIPRVFEPGRSIDNCQ